MANLYTLRGDLGDAEQVADVLYGSGCDDATISVERDGSAGYADFDRETGDALTAVVSAVEQIEAASFQLGARSFDRPQCVFHGREQVLHGILGCITVVGLGRRPPAETEADYYTPLPCGFRDQIR
jgi:hypothetical protein